MMTPNESELEIRVKELELELQRSKETMLDVFAAAALASGRCAAHECYDWAKAAMVCRENHV